MAAAAFTPIVATAFTYMVASATTITGKFPLTTKSQTEKHQKTPFFYMAIARHKPGGLPKFL
jgi:hypothetical protein